MTKTKTTKIRFTKDGRMVFEYRFTADRASQSRYSYDGDDYEAFEANMAAEEIRLPEIGNAYMVATRTYVGPNGDKPESLVFAADDGKGWPGNSNRNICRYHGWRGTSDDWALHGFGVRQCVEATVKGSRSKVVRVVFGKDLKKDQE